MVMKTRQLAGLVFTTALKTIILDHSMGAKRALIIKFYKAKVRWVLRICPVSNQLWFQ